MSIQEHLNKIRNAIKGSEVRESIAKGIETAYDDASEKDNANMEVKIARGTHPNLRSRLEEVTTQLAQKANQTEVDLKADKNNTYTKSDVYNKTEVNTKTWNMDNMAQDVKTAMTGGSVPVVGVNSVGTTNIVDKAVNSSKLGVYTGDYDFHTFINTIDVVNLGDGSLSVSFPGSNRTIYIYKKTGIAQNASLDPSYIIPHNGRLVFNLDTTSIYVVSTIQEVGTENFVTLLHCYNGKIRYGVLNDVIMANRMDDVEEHSGVWAGDMRTFIRRIDVVKTSAYDVKLLFPGGNRRIYAYTKTGSSYTVELESEYTMPHGTYLIWDLTDGTISTDKTPNNIESKLYIVLAHVYSAEVDNGFLLDIINNTRLRDMDKAMLQNANGTVQIDGSNGAYMESDYLTGKVYIKFGYAYIYGVTNLFWGDIKTDTINGVFATSPKGEEDCMVIDSKSALVVNQDSQLEVKTLANLTHLDTVYALCLYGTITSGKFLETYKGTNGISLANEYSMAINGHRTLPRHLKKTVDDALNRATEKQNKNSFSFVYLTDVHFYTQKTTSYEYQNILKYIGDSIDIEGYIDTGDNIEDNLPSREDMQLRIREFNSNLSSVKHPYMTTIGNHDANHITSRDMDVGLSDKDMHNILLLAKRNGAKFDTDNKYGNYYYIDFPHIKTRVISLNCHDIPFESEDGISYKHSAFHTANYSNKQLNWVANTALDMSGKEDWLVIPIGHSPTDSTDIIDADAQPRNSAMMHGILKAFVTGTEYSIDSTDNLDTYSVSCDFTDKEGVIPVHFFGHTHRDNVAFNDFNMYNSPKLIRGNKLNTDEELTITIVTIDPVVRKLYFTRIGEGSDLELDY